MAIATQPLPLQRPRRLHLVEKTPPSCPAPGQLWLGLYLPNLPLEALVWPSAKPQATVAGEGTRCVVIACNAAAYDAGVHPGLLASAARALSSELRLLPHNETRESQVVERLAGWAMRYTPTVALDGNVLLLEVLGSVRLFGGPAALQTDALEQMRELKYTAQCAIAPTVLAARWLAMAGEAEPVTDISQLPGRLAALQVKALGWPDQRVRRLESFGVRRLGDVMRLPRDGLARRLGRHWPSYLDRALGRLPDPREAFHPPSRFDATLDLPQEAECSQALMSAIRHLLGELEAFLVSRDIGAQSLEVKFRHREGQATRVALTLRQPARNAAELAELMAHRLETVPLSSPVRSLTLRAGQTRPWQAESGDLIGGSARADIDMEGLIQRLQARLGPDAVYGVEPAADHRPERAWRRTAPLRVKAGPLPTQPRPLWLLPRPRPLGGGDTPACCKLLKGPERIVGGWWDGYRVARDYYVARHADGRRLWVYRELRDKDRGWFLHGFFE